MKLILNRFFENENTTIGSIDINGKTYYTCENSWKDNHRGISCIPTGVYKVKKHISPSKGLCFSIEDVKDRDYILIHSGNTHKDTQGCVLPGISRGKLKGCEAVLQSKDAMKELLSTLPDEFELEILITSNSMELKDDHIHHSGKKVFNNKKNNNMITALVGSAIAKKLFGSVANKLKKKAINKISSKFTELTGISDEKEAQAHIEAMSSKDLLKLKTEVAKCDVELEKEMTKKHEATIDLLKIDANSSDKFTSRARPSNYYSYTACMIVIFMVCFPYALITDKSGPFIEMIKAFDNMIIAWTGIIGLYNHNRTKEKINK